jgi:hypothetical protein
MDIVYTGQLMFIFIFYSFFSRQQYFDNQGMFISLVFSVPILLNCMIMVVSVNVVNCIAAEKQRYYFTSLCFNFAHFYDTFVSGMSLLPWHITCASWGCEWSRCPLDMEGSCRHLISCHGELTGVTIQLVGWVRS